MVDFVFNSMVCHFKTSPCKVRLSAPETITLANIEASTRRATRRATMSSTAAPLPTTTDWEAWFHETGGSRGDPEVDNSTVGATSAAMSGESTIIVNQVKLIWTLKLLMMSPLSMPMLLSSPRSWTDYSLPKPQRRSTLRCRKVNCSRV